MKNVLALAAAVALLLVLPLSAQSLEDQLGGRLDLGAELARGGVLLFWSDRRESSADLAAWARLLAAESCPGLRVVAVADLKALPFFVPRQAVARQLAKDEPAKPILLDWKGEAAARLGIKGGEPSVLLVGPGGTVVARARGQASAEAAAPIRAALKRP